jgi:hypothetical protein
MDRRSFFQWVFGLAAAPAAAKALPLVSAAPAVVKPVAPLMFHGIRIMESVTIPRDTAFFLDRSAIWEINNLKFEKISEKDYRKMNRNDPIVGIAFAAAVKILDLDRIEQVQPGVFRVRRKAKIGGSYAGYGSATYDLFTREDMQAALEGLGL